MANDFVQRTTSAPPGAIEHLLPRNATLDEVELSIVIPAMNEEITVGEFIEWCKEGLTFNVVPSLRYLQPVSVLTLLTFAVCPQAGLRNQSSNKPASTS